MTLHVFSGNYDVYIVSARTEHTARKKLEKYLRKQGTFNKIGGLKYRGAKGDVIFAGE